MELSKHPVSVSLFAASALLILAVLCPPVATQYDGNIISHEGIRLILDSGARYQERPLVINTALLWAELAAIAIAGGCAAAGLFLAQRRDRKKGNEVAEALFRNGEIDFDTFKKLTAL